MYESVRHSVVETIQLWPLQCWCWKVMFGPVLKGWSWKSIASDMSNGEIPWKSIAGMALKWPWRMLGWPWIIYHTFGYIMLCTHQYTHYISITDPIVAWPPYEFPCNLTVAPWSAEEKPHTLGPIDHGCCLPPWCLGGALPTVRDKRHFGEIWVGYAPKIP